MHVEKKQMQSLNSFLTSVIGNKGSASTSKKVNKLQPLGHSINIQVATASNSLEKNKYIRAQDLGKKEKKAGATIEIKN